MMQKNEIVKVKIEDIGVGGEGIGKVDGRLIIQLNISEIMGLSGEE